MNKINRVTRSTRPPRARYFKDGEQDAADVTALVRGCLIAKCEEAFLKGEFGRLMGRDHASEAVQWRALQLFQALMTALFPEEWCEPPFTAGVVPNTGLKRVGADRLKAFAELIVQGPERAGS